ncbi:MAG: hypothetical protein COS99_01500 [Candidatus Omnitrophica bacterium CG07_land_8_20_14_0_80_42_15]|uniref:Response regulatory domain-containing protein n=1 Tax=Candidatus Aquitaenariimonas noxiae TaxID=1974741 RepID=A0A2J0KUX5_9BACT|nr:MAG: hypothetical protein COS99_01500 [Candidatus Omnitrophica bacterium CG07_land_8_20_14_0_80_42_15]
MARARILVVDDEAAVRRLLEKVFTKEDYEVLSAASGEEAVTIATGKPVDLVIVDLKMPGIDGIETIRKIKKVNSGAAFIVITAFGEMASVKDATGLGVFDYITKPFDLDYIKHLVRHIVAAVRPQILPYAKDLEQVFTGELTLEEARKRKLTSFKKDLDERAEVIKGIHKFVDKGISMYYMSLSPLAALAHNTKRLLTNFYFIIISVGIVIGIIFGYIYGTFSSKSLYAQAAQKKKVSVYDFYNTLNELKFWMEKHTEQGLRIEKDSKYYK